MQQVERDEISHEGAQRNFDTMDASASFTEPDSQPFQHIRNSSLAQARPLSYTRISRSTTEKYYANTNKNRGIAVIFNHVNFKEEKARLGSDKDTQDLQLVLEKLGFTVQIHRDRTKDEIRNILLNLSQMDHTDNDCFLLAMMSHGSNDGQIYAYDEKYLAQDLWEHFIGTNCETLIGKPKLFFIQACRGKLVDPGVVVPKSPRGKIIDHVDATSEDDNEYIIPVLADLLIMFSTSEGYYSFRNPEEGSWFIQSLVKELKENSHEELMTILTGVNRRVAYDHQSYIPKSRMDACKQMPNIISMLTKGFKLTPKQSDIESRDSIPYNPDADILKGREAALVVDELCDNVGNIGIIFGVLWIILVFLRFFSHFWGYLGILGTFLGLLALIGILRN